ncbi:uncharacterized protein LOC134270695, partial [Saccostrea cucullata]|uniref:uncharacterized protein LOC134270695 n=1 Tax=Saccostrea cuccullata TaxID=36930 RepID=UPI002ED1DAF1
RGDNQDAVKNPKKKLKKKKKKLKKEKRDNNEKPPQVQKPVRSPKKKTEVTSDSSQDKDRVTSKEEKEDKNAGKHLTDWTMDEFRSLLDSLESSIKQPSPQHNRLPESVWEEVKVENHSPDVCRAAWTKICHVTKTHMSLQQMIDVARDLMEKNKNVIKILIGNKDPNFPNAPSVHRANSYNLYTKRRLEETPRPTFKEIAEGWKVLSEREKQAF